MIIIIPAYVAINKCNNNVKYKLVNFESYVGFKIQKYI